MDAMIKDLEWLHRVDPKSKVTLQQEVADMFELPIHTTAGHVLEVVFAPEEVEEMQEIPSEDNMEL